MKVLHVLDHSLPLYDGYAFRSQNIFRAQQDEGIEPTVVTSPKHEEFWTGDWRSEETFEGVPYHRTGAVKRLGGLPFTGEVRLMRSLERRIEEVARRVEPSILHAHSPVLDGFPALRVGRRLALPVVYEIRAFWEDAAADAGTYAEGSAKYRLVRYLETRCCRQAAAVVTICEGLKSDLLQRGIPEQKITVVPNAIRPEMFPPSPPDEELRRSLGPDAKHVLAFMGSFYHFEGLDILVEAVGRLAPEFPGLRVVLVGSGEMKERLQERVEGLGLEKIVLLTGRLPHERMPGVYALADVLVYPRKPMRLTDLVTPLKPLEAMAMGKALIASDVGGHRELIQHGVTGLLHRAGDPDDLTKHLGTLLRDADLRGRLGSQGKEWVVGNRTWDRNARAYQALYGRLGAATEDVRVACGGAR